MSNSELMKLIGKPHLGKVAMSFENEQGKTVTFDVFFTEWRLKDVTPPPMIIEDGPYDRPYKRKITVPSLTEMSGEIKFTVSGEVAIVDPPPAAE